MKILCISYLKSTSRKLSKSDRSFLIEKFKIVIPESRIWLLEINKKMKIKDVSSFR
jgi:hypothetical protein